mmetsp:Transcript_101494/g.316470  ORF Transcript_101494/g.316470 Transcript_101494/m.316470 type:complete len:241 (-) Transcript_101494:62-784(-)
MEQRVEQMGSRAVFHGDSRAARFRLDPCQGERVLHQWHEAVPTICEALDGQVSPKKLESVLRKTFYIGELTAKELFVHLSYARPKCADTTRHVPIGEGARCGARLIFEGEAAVAAAAAAQRERGPPGSVGRPRKSSASGQACDRAQREKDLEAVRQVAASHDEHLRHVPALREACREYQETATHRDDPLRNCRVAREHLLDLADVEVMLCFYKNYCKMRARWGNNPVPPYICPRGWTRRM